MAKMTVTVVSLALIALALCGPAAASARPHRALHSTEGAEAGPSAPAGAAPATSRKRPSIVVIGDGLTESAFYSKEPGFGSMMQDKYKRKVRAVRAVLGRDRGACRERRDDTRE